MRRILMASLALALCFSLISEASEENKIFKPIPSGKDSSFVTDAKAMIFHPNITKPKLPNNNNPILLETPANDDCGNAEAIGDTTEMPFSTEDATFDGPGACITTPNIWYIYTASATGQVDVRTCDVHEIGTTLDSRLAVYGTADCFTYAESPTPVDLQGGETIETATPITDPLPVAYNGSTEDYDNDYELDCIYEPTQRDVVYSYTPSANDSINIFLTSAYETDGYFNTALGILDADGNQLACNDDDFPKVNSAILNFPVTGGQTYYIVVSAGGNYSYSEYGDYTLTITSPEYILLDCDDNTCGQQARVTFDAIEGNEYLIEIGGDPGDEDSVGTGILTINPLPPPPANDDCENATDGGILTIGSSIQYTGYITSSTPDCTNHSRPEAWVKFTTEETMDIRIDFCGTPMFYQFLDLYITTVCPFCSDDGYINFDNDSWPEEIHCPEGEISMLWTDLPADTYWYPIGYDCPYAEGDYVLNVSSLEPQACGYDSLLLGQDPSEWNDWLENYEAYLSEYLPENMEARVFGDDFSGITEPIHKITLWGAATSSDSSYSDCDSDSLSLLISFCNDNNGYPGDTVATYNAVASLETTGEIVSSYHQKKFTITLDPPFDPADSGLSNGWMMIEGNDPDCWFRWQNSSISGNSSYYYAYFGTWHEVQANLAFCLYGADDTGVKDDQIGEPAAFELLTNYPNPFNATTSIQFSLSKTDAVKLTIYDLGGRKIKTLCDGTLSSGPHSIIWDGTNEAGEVVSSGVYFYRLASSEGTLGKSMVLLK